MSALTGARWDEAKMLIPAGEYTSEDWRNHYAEHPDSLMQMLGDVFRVYKSEERKKAGLGNPQGGRRKSQIDGSLDELWSILTPRFSMKPVQEAFDDLRGQRTFRAMALRIGMPAAQLHFKLSGKRPMTRHDLEQIATGLDVHPAYFREWRTMIVQELLEHVFTANPNLSIALLKGISR